MIRSPRVAVIGAGILGSSIAYHLALAGARVTVIDREQVVVEATAKSFAWINASDNNPSPYYELRLQSMLEWRALDEALDGALPLRWGGSLEWRDTEEELVASVESQSQRGYPVRLVGRQEIQALEPAIAEPPAQAAFASLEGCVEPVGAADCLLQAALRHGAELRRGTEAALVPVDGGGQAAVKLDGEALAADLIVLAAGVECERLLASVGVTLAMANSPGLLIRTAPTAPLLGRMVLSPGAHIKQDLDGRLVSGETFGGGPVPNDPWAEGERLLARIQGVLIGAAGLELEAVTTGVRPIPKDGFPAIGRLSGPDNLYLAVMHSGITLAPLVGRLAAAELLNERAYDILKPFRPERLTAGGG